MNMKHWHCADFQATGKLLKCRLSLPEFNGFRCMLQQFTIIKKNVRENVDKNRTKEGFLKVDFSFFCGPF